MVHASGVLDDRWLRDMDGKSVRRLYGLKAAGAWYLHKHSLEDAMRHFLVYSSVSATFGNVGQVNYAASTSYLDALVHVCQMQGLSQVSVQWPEIADVGMAAVTGGSIGIKKENMLNLGSR